MKKEFKRNYKVAIDTVPLPEEPEERIQLIADNITSVIN